MEFLTRKELAKYFRVSMRTIDRWIESGSLKGYKLGAGRTASMRVTKSEVKRFLKRSKIKPKS